MTLQILSATDLAEAAAEDGEVLGEDEDGPAVDGAPSGHDRIAGGPLVLDAEPDRLVADEHVDLLERALVEQELDSFASGQLAQVVLAVDRPLAAGVQRLFAQHPQIFDPLFRSHLDPGISWTYV